MGFTRKAATVNILQVSPYVVYPPNDGGSHRTHGLVKEFPKLGDRVDRYCQGISSDLYRRRNLQHEIQISENYREYRHINLLHDIAKIPMLLDFPNVFSNRALKLMPGPLRVLADNSDIVLVREPWQVSAVFELTDRPIVYSSHNVEIERFAESRENGRFHRLAYDRVLTLEQTALECADLVICTSDRDANTYRNRFGFDGEVHIAPNATYSHRLREHRPKSEAATQIREKHRIPDDANVAIFVGSNHPPNVEAVKEILSMAENGNVPDFHFLVVGSVCTAVDSSKDNVTLAGFVDDLEAYFDASDVALNPITSGGGSNIKILDYFARSLPVISTPFGIRGLDASDSKNVVITDIETFSDELNVLFENPKFRRRIAANAHELVAKKYTWEAVSTELYHTLHNTFHH